MKNLIIIGAGSFGREVMHWARASRAYDRDWRLKGFLDDNLNVLDKFNYTIPILATTGEYEPETNDVFVCAVGDPAMKKKLCGILLEKGAQFTNVIHPSVIITDTSSLGNGVILCPNVTVSCNTRLGNFVSINVASIISHDVVIEDYCQLSNLCDLTGKTYLEEGVFLGSHASILPGVRVGAWSKVGAGSIVLSDVKSGITVIGIPARPLPSREK